MATRPSWLSMYLSHERGATRVSSADLINRILIVKYDRKLGMNVVGGEIYLQM